MFGVGKRVRLNVGNWNIIKVWWITIQALFQKRIVFTINKISIFVLNMYVHYLKEIWRARVAQWVGLHNNSYKPISITNTAWVRTLFVNYKIGALDSQPQVIKFTSCLPVVGGSLRVLRLLPPLKLVAMI
jgi:hypothetical protein